MGVRRRIKFVGRQIMDAFGKKPFADELKEQQEKMKTQYTEQEFTAKNKENKLNPKKPTKKLIHNTKNK